MSGFFQALPLVLDAEGGLVDDPDDRGGLTNHGVTQVTYNRWLEDTGRPKQSVSKITNDEVISIYHTYYWVKGHCDALAWPVSYVHFDGCVNHGTAAAIKILQRALDVADDGHWGPKTQAAADATDPDELVERILWARLEVYARIVSGSNSQRKFLLGWLNRMLDLRRRVFA